MCWPTNGFCPSFQTVSGAESNQMLKNNCSHEPDVTVASPIRRCALGVRIKLFVPPPQECVHTLSLFIPKAVGGQSNACHREACCESCLRAAQFFFFLESGHKIQPVSLLKNRVESTAVHHINTVHPIAGLATVGRRSHSIKIWSVGKNICVHVQQICCCAHKA